VSKRKKTALSKNKISNRISESVRPDVFAFHDYREFLSAWIEYTTALGGFSGREFSRRVGLSPGYLPSVLKRRFDLSQKALKKIIPVLKLESPESAYLKLLHKISDGETQIVRSAALKEIQKFRNFRRINTQEVEAYRYLSAWHIVAIREMVGLKYFKLDPKWIRKRLRFKVSIAEIRTAIDFLIDHGFLVVGNHGKVMTSDLNVKCSTGVYRVALAEFHHQMLNLAIESIYSSMAAERNLRSYTLSIPDRKIAELKEIQEEAFRKIASLQEPGTGESVYQVNFVAFPLTKAD